MTRELDILRVMPFFEPAFSFGGSVSQAAATTAELAKRGHRVSVMTSDLGIGADIEKDRWVERRGYRVFYASAQGAQTRPPYPSPKTGSSMSVAMQEADILCMNVGLTLVNAKARNLARGRGLPYIYNAEGALCPLRLREKRLAKLAFLTLFERRIIRDAAGLQAVTKKERQDLLQQGADPQKVHVIPNAVAMTSATASVEFADLRQRLGIPRTALILLFFGRIHPLKGLDLMLEACLPLLSEHSDRHLVIAGPDEGHKARLEALSIREGLAGQIHFPGMLAGSEREEALHSADVFLLSSMSEGLPLAALEAAAAGLPLVISEGCNLPEVTDYGAGRVTPAHAEPLRKALNCVLLDQEERRRCGENAKRMVQEKFSLGPTVDRLESLYLEIARG